MSTNDNNEQVASYQQRVQPWMMECFGPMIAGDREERNHRFLEEALELVQSTGCTASEAHQLVDYVYGRPVGEPAQEVGGVMVTLAALCLVNDMDMHAAGETELARIWTKVEAIRAKQAAKPKHSPLPATAPAVHVQADFEAWARSEGLISESHGIRFVNSMCDITRKAFNAGGAALAGKPAVVPEGLALVKDSEGSALRILREALHFYADGSHFHMHDPSAWDTVSGEPPNFYEDERNTATVEDGSVAKKALEDTFMAGSIGFGHVYEDAAPSPAQAQPVADAARQTEAHKLARILFGMVEGDGRVEGADIYADGYSAPDGDVYVLRAAELLVEQAAEAEELTRYVEHFALAAHPSPAQGEALSQQAAALEQAAQACDQQADGTNGPYRSACLQCADAVRVLRDRALAAKPAKGGA